MANAPLALVPSPDYAGSPVQGFGLRMVPIVLLMDEYNLHGRKWALPKGILSHLSIPLTVIILGNLDKIPIAKGNGVNGFGCLKILLL